jgi:hypothetical protein
MIHTPTRAEVDAITALADPALRNLRITQCYHQLAAAVRARTGTVANWCTFATWATKQAGQSFRKEDLARTIEAALAEVAAAATPRPSCGRRPSHRNSSPRSRPVSSPPAAFRDGMTEWGGQIGQNDRMTE